jgi:hypothetical protein
MDIFNDKGWSSEEEKLPTLRQYLKKTEGKDIPKRFLVTLIWIPNKFPQYTIECDKFRVPVPSKCPLGKSLSNHLDSIVDSDMALSVSLLETEGKTGNIVFTKSKEKGRWNSIGDDPILGWRFVFE